MTPRLETERLLLLPLALDDAPAIQRLFPQWRIVRYLNPRVPWPYPSDGAETHLRTIALPAVEHGEEWYWSLRLKLAPDVLIGIIHLIAAKSTETDNRGFWIDPAHQGRGLATEAANAVTDFWFNTLGFHHFRTSKAAPNRGSSRVTEKQGMRLTGTSERDYVGGRYATEIWEITREEWNARRRRDRAGL
ncbi:MAG TPA: GNAT family N-acetyltransferase [Vineibacter sp.]|nr:GNAT family N-acetyltransferase [Vineibacter sp.]